MKLFHTSDWHLGRMLFGRSLLSDQRWFLEEVLLPAVQREKPACLILAGDIYDRQIAPPEAIRLFDSVLSRLAESGCKVCAISGNHDGADRIAIMKGALRASGVFLATSLEDAFPPVLLEEGGQKVQLFLLPYFDSARARDFLGDDSLRGEGACMKALIDRMLPLFEPGAAHILVSHCFAAGAEVSDSESALFVGGSGEVPPALFSPFDYAALGHLHAPQRAGEKGRYSGSPLKYSIDEAGQQKGFCRLEWDGGTLCAEPVPIAPLHDVRRLFGPMEELLAAGRAQACQDYVEIVLEDRAPVFQARDKLLPYYPNLLSVSNPWAVSGQAGERARQLRGQNDLTVFTAFLKEVCGMEPAEKDMELFREVFRDIEE